jgi:hypothetical protein
MGRKDEVRIRVKIVTWLMLLALLPDVLTSNC